MNVRRDRLIFSPSRALFPMFTNFLNYDKIIVVIKPEVAYMKSNCIIPERYAPRLDSYDTQRAIELIKVVFRDALCDALTLKRVSAPLFVREDSGLNDNLNGYERPVSFDVPSVGTEAQVVHSLAKWKRLALKRYGFYEGRAFTPI